MCSVVRNLNPLGSRVKILLQLFQTNCSVLTDSHSTGTGLCLKLIIAGVWRAVNRYGLCLELNRAGVWRAVNRYGLCWELNRAGVGSAVDRYGLFGTDQSRRGACS